jgi:hypothetical protein
VVAEETTPSEVDSERAASTDIAPIEASVDLRPRGPVGSHVVTVLQNPKGDAYLNPTRRSFTAEELERIAAFATEDAKLAGELNSRFHRELNTLGNQILDQGRHDGSVDTRTLSAEERAKLPWNTEDWLKPIFVRWQGPQQTWVQIDLRAEAPELARLCEAGQEEHAAARRRLREFIQSLTK